VRIGVDSRGALRVAGDAERREPGVGQVALSRRPRSVARVAARLCARTGTNTVILGIA
jgi:hypothetical protein